MRTRINSLLTVTILSLGVTAGVGTKSASAYPIDCAILLCMAGGFPASAECTAAKAEVIRRITPIPVEPPLQIWRCPMRIDPQTAAAIGLSAVNMNSKGYTKEVLDLQNSIDILDMKYTVSRSDGDVTISESVRKGVYGDDTFDWRSASYIKGDPWLADAMRGYRKSIYRDAGSDGQYQVKVGEENAHSGSFRAILFRFKDHEGNYKIERVNY